MRGLDPRLLIDLELALLAEQTAQHGEADRTRDKQWRSFVAVAPEPVLTYVWDVDADVAAERVAFDLDASGWFHRRHPLFDDVLEGLDRAVHSGVPDPLSYTLGWMLKNAWWHLEYWCACQRQPVTGGIWMDAISGGMAADALLGWSVAEAHRAWLEPQRFLERWRSAATDDVETLTRAGLHRAELTLLAADG